MQASSRTPGCYVQTSSVDEGLESPQRVVDSMLRGRWLPNAPYVCTSKEQNKTRRVVSKIFECTPARVACFLFF